MNQDNPWRKQMMHGNSNSNSNSTPPPNTTTPSNPPPPGQLNNPWKQKIAQQTGSKLTSSPQAPYKKPQNSPQTNTVTGSGGGLVNNPWVKGRIDKDKQAKEAKEKEEQQRLKREEEERLKREEEERIMKEEEQRERVRRQEKEREDERKETERMVRQDEMSRQFEKQQEQRIKQLTLKSSTKSPTKSPAKKPLSKDIKPAKSPSKRFPQPLDVSPIEKDTSLAFLYYHEFSSISSPNTSYPTRLSSQKTLLSLYHQFLSSSLPLIRSTIDSHQIPTHPLSLSSSLTTLQFIKSTSTRNSNTILYDESMFTTVRKLIYWSNLVNNGIVEGLRRRGDIGLRIGMVGFVEYRGVGCLVRGECKEEREGVTHEVEKNQEVKKRVNVLLKEMGETGLKGEYFQYKLVRDGDEEMYILYLKESALSNLSLPHLPLNLSQLVRTLNWLDTLDLITTHPHSFSSLTASTPHQSSLHSLLTLCHTISQIYRSAHSQIPQSDFLSLITRWDSTFISLLQDSGLQSPQRPLQKGLFLEIVAKMLGVEMEYDEAVFQTGNVEVKRIKTKAIGYGFEGMEVVDVAGKYLGLVREGKRGLAEESFELREELAEIRCVDKDDEEEKMKLAISKAEFLHLKGNHQQSFELLTSLTLPPLSLLSLSHSTLLLLLHSTLLNQSLLLSTFSSILSSLTFLFNSQTHYHSYLYCLLASYYLPQPNKSEQVITLYKLALEVDRKVFGEDSVEMGEIWLAIAGVEIREGRGKETREAIEKAERVYQGKESRLGRMECVVMLAELAFSQNDRKLGEENLTKALKFYQKLGRVSEIEKVLLLKLKHEKEVQMREVTDLIIQKIVQELFEVGNSYGKEDVVRRAIEMVVSMEVKGMGKGSVEKLKGILEQDEEVDEQESESEQQNNFIPTLLKSLKTTSLSLLLRTTFTTSLKSSQPTPLFTQLKSYITPNKLITILSPVTSPLPLS